MKLRIIPSIWLTAWLNASSLSGRSSEVMLSCLTRRKWMPNWRNQKTAMSPLAVVKKAALYATPLFLCVAVVELSDVMFAFDSVPAIIAVSREPLIVYSAMMFAILGLRTLYFVLEALKQYLVHLEKAVIVLLFFIAAKLGLNATDHIWHHGYSIAATTSLYVVLGVLALGILASVMFPGKPESEEKGS
ncbi:hypothetical protein O5903_23270 [Escherichia coli]|nr:hypothetical protein [Escherichia coli]